MMAPFFMMQLQANLEIEFEDIDEVLQHPMAGPFLKSGSTLIEGMIGDREQYLKKLNDDFKPEKKLFAQGTKFVNGIFDILCDMNTSDSKETHIEASVSVPHVGVSADFMIKSAGLKEFLKLAMMANPGMEAIRKELDKIRKF